MNRAREIAKFACGAEAFHAFFHACLWYSGTTVKVFGIRENPEWHRAGAIGNAILALALGIYAWGENGPQPGTGESRPRRDGSGEAAAP